MIIAAKMASVLEPRCLSTPKRHGHEREIGEVEVNSAVVSSDRLGEVVRGAGRARRWRFGGATLEVVAVVAGLFDAQDRAVKRERAARTRLSRLRNT